MTSRTLLGRAHQSFSETLNLIKIRRANWSIQMVDIKDEHMLVPPDRVFIYIPLAGAIKISVESDMDMISVVVDTGEAVFVSSKLSHVRRTVAERKSFEDGPDAPVPSTDTSGRQDSEGVLSRAACCALNVRWPGGFDRWSLPAIIKVDRENNPLIMPRLGATASISTLEPILTRAASYMLVCAIRDHPDCEKLMREANFRDPITRALQFLDLHPFNPWTVDGLAKKVGLGRSTFASRFHTELGKTPMEALTDLRMDLSMQLLKDTELKITEVAERVGYQSSSAFIRRFIAHFGMTPGKVRGDVE